MVQNIHNNARKASSKLVQSLLVFVGCDRFTDMSIESLRQLPRSEKLKLMETLWEELSRPDDEFESPAWHANELAVTERRLAEGKEQALDWDAAKASLLSNVK
jgi:myosin-crossreactive antigen